MKRRTLPKGTGERISLSTRTTAGIRDRLEEAAKQSGRSLSQEMEFRLAESFVADDIVEHATALVRERELPFVDSLGGPETYSFLQDIAFLVDGIEASNGRNKRWFNEPELKAQLFKVLEAALPELLRAERSDKQPSAFLRMVEYAKYLPEQPKKPKPEMPKGARFMTDEELKRMFYRNEDNA
ncbi:hypothetical protein [Methylobacterium sp. SyP6R]|uniref:hypothetical protein n=1 Tax=Methylobacterium sp. SyP6R TaxID=2718876 RepID=UPI001F2CF215|nr:hypothetical protein [Methylobacterium sp. SyP6R]MCF4123848.1 hypothetical protein [Methylobacterium sp. SyP6R]